ncbi:MAG: hypothetical protein CVU09_08430 [Bacteroidetes bacterium HGW-Bacteroidetes-4]|jgi:hypothetical protein|nr:MAG: hypothetical protein CVU09_08430 [Bacteroidetes bacterium HGW-Bacteroidetes-4]
MKKSLLLMAAFSLAAVVFVNAQEEPVTWSAEAYCVENNVPENGDALTALQEFTLGALTFSAYEKTGITWLYKPSTAETFDFNGVTYHPSYVQGQTNPKNGYPLVNEDWSAVAHFVSTSTGSLDIVFKFGYNKRFWVAEIPDNIMEDINMGDSTAISAYAYEFDTEQTYWGGFFDPTGTPPGYYYSLDMPTTDPGGVYYTGITLNIKPGHEYFAFFSGSKIMLSGLTFTPTVSVKDNLLNAAKVVSEDYYNIVGQKLAKPQLGGLNIIVKTMSDGSVKTEKVFISK